MELLPGEFFKSITVGCEHPDAVFHPAYFFFILPDLFFLMADFNGRAHPSYDIGPRLEKHQENEYGRSKGGKLEKAAVRSVEYAPWSSHLSLKICAKIIIFERFSLLTEIYFL